MPIPPPLLLPRQVDPYGWVYLTSAVEGGCMTRTVDLGQELGGDGAGRLGRLLAEELRPLLTALDIRHIYMGIYIYNVCVYRGRERERERGREGERERGRERERGAEGLNEWARLQESVCQSAARARAMAVGLNDGCHAEKRFGSAR